ncbi:PREDICTED: tRNA:m(4)X modification enzyme TRM13 homolog [Polistes dominula]|uniref:tRNA:m(4)X modification enzyme TRM13 homolog n=1 Tax=Polistes dominula TaxID=743375 RepID=A0ABM1JFF0_POLDO|nr:PREDICTED: tRNA:m(4)X modification enzyme TRM13 homolog [Polistes dominula]
MNDSYYIEVVTCPYNENHRIAKSRIQKHIVKCEKNYPSDYKVICPFNASHRLFKYEINKHIAICPAGREINLESSKQTENYELQHETNDLIESSENWDEVLDSVSDIKEDLHSTNIISNRKDYSKYCNDDEDLRLPHGYSEVMLIEVDEEINSEDIESIASNMGIGRGKVDSDKIHLLRSIGIGRGKLSN